jgi:SP family general alpha glucoside:H+ symporter-like MFS transporter
LLYGYAADANGETGIPGGIFSILPVTYAAEVMPVALRTYLLSNINMCWLLGQICGVATTRFLVDINSEWSYRISFGIQWAFAVPLLFGVYFAPESPCKLKIYLPRGLTFSITNIK